ncbi:MAG: Ig-like domain-containing protein [Bacilli bacterium]
MKKIRKIFMSLIVLVFAVYFGLQTVGAYTLTGLYIGGNPVYYKGTSSIVQIPNVYEKQKFDMRAVWVSAFVGDISFASEATFRDNFEELLDDMDYYNLNTMVFHVRTHNDAFYPSALNPKSWRTNGIDFNTFDPIAWAVNRCHEEGYEFHAWLNPYRVGNPSAEPLYNYSYPTANPASNSANLLTTSDNNLLILDPSKAIVRNFLVNTCMELIQNYDIDAIHFDDYFYASGANTGRSDADKRADIDAFISSLSTSIRTYNANNNRYVQLGISPTGVYRTVSSRAQAIGGTYDSNGTYSVYGSNNSGCQEHYGYYLCADTKKWVDNEWIDYITPQSYWGFTHTTGQFADLMEWWAKVVDRKKVNLYSGMGIGRTDYSWGTNVYEAEMQTRYLTQFAHVRGTFIYKYIYLKNARDGDTSFTSQKIAQLKNIWNYKSLIPETRTMTAVNLGEVSDFYADGSYLTWSLKPGAKRYAIYRTTGTTINSTIDELITVVGSSTNSYIDTTAQQGISYRYGIRAISGTNTESTLTYQSPFVPATAVTISGASSLYIANTTQLTAVVSPTGASQAVNWSSNNTGVATVDAFGKVTGVSTGTVTITARSATHTNIYDTHVISVTRPSPVSVTINGPNAVALGQTVNLSATVSPAGAIQTVSWTSSNTSLATVNSAGQVTANSTTTGEVTITARSTADTSIFDTKILSISNEAITISGESTAEVGFSNSYIASSLSGDPYTYNWSVSDTTIAIIESTGRLVPLRPGVVNITATTVENGLYDTMQVTISQNNFMKLEPFESNVWQTQNLNNGSGTASINNDLSYVKFGSKSLKVTYNLLNATGTDGVYVGRYIDDNAYFGLTPGAIGLGFWCYGDGKGANLRSQLNVNGTVLYAEPTPATVNWTGWRYVEFAFPETVSASQITFAIRVLAIGGLPKISGTLYFDNFSIIYNNVPSGSTDVTSVAIGATSNTIDYNTTRQLTSIVSPSTGAINDVQWYSSNTNVLTVTPQGLINAVGYGVATINCVSSVNTNRMDSKTFTVPGGVPTSISVSGALSVVKGGNTTLTATALPSSASQDVNWYSSNTSIATVSSSGVVTGVNVGNVIITAKSALDENIYGTKEIAVNYAPPVSVSITGANQVNKNSTITLSASVSPVNANQAVVWSSANTSIATVNQLGQVTGVSGGIVNISAASAADGSIVDTHSVTVIDTTMAPNSISVTGENYLEIGSTTNFTATALPSYTCQDVNWSSSNSNIATVDQTGKVTAVATGLATITATSTLNGSVYGSKQIEIVSVAVTSVTISGNTSMTINNTLQLSVEVLPSNATNTSVNWQSSNPLIATVSSNGLVSAVGVGTVTITATSVSNPDKFDTHEITVNGLAGVTYYNINLSVNNSSYGTIAKSNYDTTYGSSNSILVSPNSGYRYLFLAENNKVISFQTTYAFKVNSDVNYKAYFVPNNMHYVLFMDQNRNILSLEICSSGASVSAPSTSLIPTKQGYTFSHWSEAYNNVTEDLIILPIFIKNVSDIYTITIQNGTVPSVTAAYDSTITVTANSFSTFSYWMRNGEIVSYDLSYTFSVYGDETVTAVLSGAVAEEPVASISPNIIDTEIENGFLSFVGAYSLPEDYTLIEKGMLIYQGNLESGLTIATPGVNKIRSLIATNNNEFAVSLSGVLSTQKWNACTYVSYLYNSNVYYKYSNVVTYQAALSDSELLANMVASLPNHIPANYAFPTYPGLTWAYQTGENEDLFDIASGAYKSVYSLDTAYRTIKGTLNSHTATKQINFGILPDGYTKKHYNSVSAGVGATEWNGWTLTRESDTAVLFLVKDLVNISVSSNTTYTDSQFAAIWAAQDVIYKSCGNVIRNTSTNANTITFNFNSTAFNGENVTNEVAVKIDVDGEILGVYYNGQTGITLSQGQALYVTKYLDRQLGFNTGYTVGSTFALEQVRDFNKTYVVTFNVDGVTNNVTVNSNTAVTKPADPVKSGYTFVEWRLNGVAYNFNTLVTSNITLVAYFEATVTYTVTFTVDGTTYTTSTVNSGDMVTRPADPTKSGYTFVEWQLNGSAYNFNTPVTSNITLTAYFTLNTTYVVTFTVDGNTYTTSTVVSGATVAKPTDPVKSGYTFVEWRLNGSTYNFNTPVTSNITLVAYFTEDNFTITYNLNGGYWVYETREDMVNDYLDDFTAFYNANAGASLSRMSLLQSGDAGYDGTTAYIGRNYANAGNVGNFFNHASYKNKWMWMIEYLITVAHTDNVAELQKILNNTHDPLTQASAPRWETWAFLAARGDAIGTAADYSISSNANGCFGTYIEKTAYNYSAPVTSLPTPNKSSATFEGWYDNASFNGSPVTSVSSTTTLYAKWSGGAPSTYTINYALNNGSWTWTTGTVGTIQSGAWAGRYYVDGVSNLPEIFMQDFYQYLKDNNLLTSSIVATSLQTTTWAGFSTAQTDPVALYNCTSTGTYGATDGYSQFFWDSISGTIATGGFFGTEPYKSKYQNVLIHLVNLYLTTAYPSITSTDPTTMKQVKSGAGFLLDAYFYGSQSNGSGSYLNLRQQLATPTLYWSADGTTSTATTYQITTYLQGQTAVLKAPFREGYVFEGWYNNSSFSGSPITSIAAGVAPAAMYYAKWTDVATYGAGPLPTTLVVSAGQTNLTTYTTTQASVEGGYAVTWASSNTSYATVNSSGLVLAKAAGTVTITATLAADPNVEGTVTIYVSGTEPYDKLITFGSNPTYSSPATQEMTNPFYWLGKALNEGLNINEVLLTPAEIATQNTTMINQGNMRLISVTALAQITTITTAQCDALISEFGYTNKEPFKSSSWTRLTTAEYAVVTSFALMKNEPTTSTATSYIETGLEVGEGVVIYGKYSTTWLLVRSQNYFGWIPTTTVGTCTAADMLSYANSTDFAVITAERIKTTQITGLPTELRMGVRLPLVSSTSSSATIRVPTRRNNNGKLVTAGTSVAIPIDSNEYVSVGYLPYTTRNVVKQMFKMLGQPYGWGDLNADRDCSSTIWAAYKVCGFLLPRNTSQQSLITASNYARVYPSYNIGTNYSLLENVRMGAILLMSGHVMMYLGKVGDNHYIIHQYGGTGYYCQVTGMRGYSLWDTKTFIKTS